MKWGGKDHRPFALRLPSVSIFFGEFGHSKPWTVHAFGRDLRVYQLGKVCIICSRRAT
jgi:hypothetical protein